MKKWNLFFLVVYTWFSMAPSLQAADKRLGILDFAGEYLLGKTIDGIWNAATGKPDVFELENRIRRLEQLLGSSAPPVTQLRQGITQNTTREEYVKTADTALEKLKVATSSDPNAFSHLYVGSVGKLKAAFSLTWHADGSVSGVYLYPTRDVSQFYELKGSNSHGGVLTLQEYTDGNLSAKLALQKELTPAWVIWRGKMFNTDGRTLDITFQRERQ